MSKKSDNHKISRRKFLDKTGKSVAGSYLLVPALEALARDGDKGIQTSIDDSQNKVLISLNVNGKKIKVKVKPSTTLAELIRNELQLTGTKVVCNHGECGGCTVVVNDRAVYSCHMLALDADGQDVTTIEGLLHGEELNHIQMAFVDKDGLQCGFCTPGQIMSAYALLINNSNPTKDQVINEMSGNICRCGAYPKIVESVLSAADGFKH